jgi:hypothetical protein
MTAEFKHILINLINFQINMFLYPIYRIGNLKIPPEGFKLTGSCSYTTHLSLNAHMPINYTKNVHERIVMSVCV